MPQAKNKSKVGRVRNMYALSVISKAQENIRKNPPPIVIERTKQRHIALARNNQILSSVFMSVTSIVWGLSSFKDIFKERRFFGSVAVFIRRFVTNNSVRCYF